MNDIHPSVIALSSSLYRVAVRAIIVKDSALLMVKEGDDDYFSTPGGGLDYGETPIAALKRELREELALDDEGYTTSPEPVLFVQAIKEGLPRLHIYFAVQLTSGTPMVGEESAEIVWCPLEDVVKEHGGPRAGGTLEDLSQIVSYAQGA